jgi:DNA-binding GntR family transcriptional regulator
MARRPRSRPSLADAVYSALRQALLDREFDPGEPLTELALTRRFKVSRTPVREALAKLERDHLVRVVPKKGAFVRTISHDEIRDLYEVREALESLVVRLAAPRLARGELEDFETRFRELKARGPRLTAAEVGRLGEEFHRHLLKRAENGVLLGVLEQIREQIRSVWTMSLLAPRRVQALVREHLAILDALKRRDAARAERLMIVHVRRVRDAIFRLDGREV